MSHFKSVIKDTKSSRTKQMDTNLIEDQTYSEKGSINNHMERINSLQHLGDTDSFQPF